MTQYKNNLGYLGESFQYRLAHEFMENHTFFEDLREIIDQNMFTNPNLKTFIGVMKNYYDRESHVPSYEMLEIELRNISDSDRETEVYLATINKVRDTESDGTDRIKELAQRFFRQQNIVKTANEILRIAGNGDTSQYDACVGLLSDAMAKGIHNDFGESVFDHIGETLSDEYRDPIPTGIGKVDEALEGGLGKGELGVIIGPTSFGKVQPFDAQIATPSGFKNMCDIKVGDYVMGKNGKPTKVIGVYPHKNWQFYKVTFSDGVSCECGKEHLWAVNSYNQRNGTKRDNTFKVLSLGEIMENGLFVRGHHNFKIPICEAVEFEEKEVSVDPYMMGYVIGVLEKHLPTDLKSEDRYIPKDYIYNSINNRVAILRGLMDSKGFCINGSNIFTTKSKHLAENIKTIVLSLGKTVKIREEYSKLFNEKLYEICYCGNGNSERFFEKIEKSRICDGQCIKVDSEDELYLTNDFIVTHNTSLTTAMASYAACNGRKVLQIVFEDRIKQIQRKHIGRITGIEAKDLSKPENIDKVKEAIENFPQREELQKNLRIVKFPSGEKTARDIERFIRKLINSGFKPDLTIIDYFECLEHESDKSVTNDFEKEGKTMRRFEAMAGELNMALWIPSQGTKDSINLELVTMDKIGGSVKKAQIAHVILSIARTVDDIAANKATIAILKNRAGMSGKVFSNVDFNNGTCIINTDNADEFESIHDNNKKREEDRFTAQKEIIASLKK